MLLARVWQLDSKNEMKMVSSNFRQNRIRKWEKPEEQITWVGKYADTQHSSVWRDLDWRGSDIAGATRHRLMSDQPPMPAVAGVAGDAADWVDAFNQP